MTTLTQSSPASGFSGWLYRAEAWLDAKGKAAWIAATILAFIFAWPLGFALLAYMIWSKKMCRSSQCSIHQYNHPSDISASSGNAAFDAYKSETLRRLEDEQEQFKAFLQRLRDSRDKAEFDQFMADRTKSATNDTYGT